MQTGQLMVNSSPHVEQIVDDRGEVLAIIVRAEYQPQETTFVTPDGFAQQLGLVIHEAGTRIRPHIHLPLARHLKGTSETIIVRRGRTVLTVFDNDTKRIHSCRLAQGDMVVLVGGGHGFEMLEDTVLTEIKQGPYTGRQEREDFQ